MSHKIICLNCGEWHNVKDGCFGCLEQDLIKLKAENNQLKDKLAQVRKMYDDQMCGWKGVK